MSDVIAPPKPPTEETRWQSIKSEVKAVLPPPVVRFFQNYITRRVLTMFPTLLLISVIVFVVIELPPGDIVTSRLQRMESQGVEASQEYVDNLRQRFGLDKPIHERYLSWIGNFMIGDLGYSFVYAKPVNELVWERLGYTLLITISAMIFTWIVALPFGIYSAVKQYTLADYGITVFALVGLATPNFLLALLAMYVSSEYFGVSIGGLFSIEYRDATWSVPKVLDLLTRLWIPASVVGMGGTAVTMRLLRANLLDELNKPYVVTARAKGVRPLKLIFKYPLRIAINPFISTLGLLLPTLISGEAIVSLVLNLPTTGRMLLDALIAQDMYLAGSFLMLLAVLTVVGMLISDLVLAWSDPRIRYE